MKTPNELDTGLATAKPGTLLLIKDYQYTSGHKTDVVVEVLDSEEGYTGLLEEDLALLEGADAAAIARQHEIEYTDVIAAIEQLKKACETGLESRRAGESSYRGAAYEPIDGSQVLARIANNDADTRYLVGVLVHRGQDPIRTAKGAVPRAKQLVASSLELPKRNYKHAVKLTADSFTSIEIEKIPVN